MATVARQLWDRDAHDPAHNRPERLKTLIDISDIGAGDAGGTLRVDDDETFVLEPLEGIANGGARHAEPFLEGRIVQDLARRERSVEDRVSDVVVDLVAEEASTDFWLGTCGDGHRWPPKAGWGQ
ncbi:hypothetical protein GCM10009588_04020 [Microbacterium phyllosphaerae]